MNRQTLADVLQSTNQTGSYTLATVLEGAEAGSQLLLRDGDALWQTQSAGLLQNPGKAVQIKSMGAGQHCKIGLCPAWHILKRLCKGGTEHGVCSGGAQLLGKFLPVVYGKHRQVKKLCLFYKGSSHMAAAADYQLRHRTKALGKYPPPVQRKKARGSTGLQS